MAKWVYTPFPPSEYVRPALSDPEGKSCSSVGSYTSWEYGGITRYFICEEDSSGNTGRITLNSSVVNSITLDNKSVSKVTLNSNTVFAKELTASISGISYSYGNWEDPETGSEFRLVTMSFTLGMGSTSIVYWETSGKYDGPYATSGSFTSGGYKSLTVVGLDDFSSVRITIRRDSSSGPIIFDEYV